MHISDLENPVVQNLIRHCNDTWHEDMFINNLDELTEQLVKDFYNSELERDKALIIQKSLKKIYEDSLN
jgi:hypothetical protein